MSCGICLETFNKTTRSKTTCPHCSVELCRTCLQTYLLHDISDIPRCINPECSRGYEREFLDSELTRSFRLETYKAHREKVLSDRERARMPATQEDVHAYNEAKDIEREESEQLRRLGERIHALHLLQMEHSSKVYHAKRVLESHGRQRMPAQNTVAPEQTERQSFVKPCPADGCMGFLSSAWKCGLCDKWTCPDCHELKGPSRDTEHTCDPGKVLTAQLLQREAKGCPKCGVQICKIEGCDQMWCTNCNTGFNWRTGKLANGPVHNPHYFDWLRTQGQHPNTTQEQPGNCDRTMDRNVMFALRESRTESPVDGNYLCEVWRMMREAEDPYANREQNYEDIFRVLRVRYMAGEITEEDWKTNLQRNEKDSHFQHAKSQVKEVFVQASRDIIRQVLRDGRDLAQIRKQVEELLAYCNTSYATISKRFNRKTPVLTVNVS